MSETSDPMTNLVRLADHDWRRQPHYTTAFRCATACDERFIGIYPENRHVSTLECPKCGAFMLEEFASEGAYQQTYMMVWPPKGKGTKKILAPATGYSFIKQGERYEIWFWEGGFGKNLSEEKGIRPFTLKEARRLAWEHWVMRGGTGSYREIKGK